MSSAKIESRPGLYDPARPELAEVRKRVQAHNIAAITQAWSRLEGQTLAEGRLVSVDLPDLIVNSDQPAPDEADRYQLQLSSETFSDGSIFCDLQLFDTAAKLVLATLTWSFEGIGQRGKAISIEPISHVHLGYEGNGFGSGLVRLMNLAIEKALADLLEPRLGADQVLAAQAVFALITDQAKPQGKIPLAEKRERWSSQIVQQYLPNFTSDPLRTLAELGFMPHRFEGQPEFVAVYRLPGWQKTR